MHPHFVFFLKILKFLERQKIDHSINPVLTMINVHMLLFRKAKIIIIYIKLAFHSYLCCKKLKGVFTTNANCTHSVEKWIINPFFLWIREFQEHQSNTNFTMICHCHVAYHWEERNKELLLPLRVWINRLPRTDRWKRKSNVGQLRPAWRKK